MIGTYAYQDENDRAYATKLQMIGHMLPSWKWKGLSYQAANDREICYQAENDRAYATKLQMIGPTLPSWKW